MKKKSVSAGPLKQKSKAMLADKKPEKKIKTKERTVHFKTRFHAHLVTKKSYLEKTIDSLIKENNENFSKISFDGMIDELDRTDREMAAQNYYRFLDRKKFELKRIETLINRLKNDQDFGICEECERPIPEARLMIVPEAVLCVVCQEELEKIESRAHLAASSGKGLQYREDYESDEDPKIIDDAGLVTKAGSESMSLMDMEEIDLLDIPEAPEEDNETTP
ncbi:MAG: TraR/DksA family transcriptional regulator [Deltaproteobacteria bacterium]|jgi:DnaK suppressor protein|nr:TraR/DksA family transcriptional regulator [Deltaproteobacteria bacterium]